jgi:hypothetical protein
MLISSGIDSDTRSEMPMNANTSDTSASGELCFSKPRASGMPMLSPRVHTSVWSSMVLGLVRKNQARVRWKRETEVMMVVDEMSAMTIAFLRISQE